MSSGNRSYKEVGMTHNTVKRKGLALMLAIAFISSEQAFADGFEDLQRALTTLSGTSPVAGHISLTVDEKRGEEGDDDYEQNLGGITSYIEFNEDGLAIRYDRKIMADLEKDFELSAEDEEAKTPTLQGLNELRTRDVTAIISESKRLLRLLKDAELQSEQVIEFEGQQVRELVFNLPLNSIIKEQRTRDYVDKFTSEYRVLIDEHGFPISSTMTYSGKGRAYIVLTFKATGKRNDRYQVVGNRLVNVQSHEFSQYDSTFGKGSNETFRTFDVVLEPRQLLSGH